MPNWCNNTIEISHEDRSKMEALVAAVNEGKFFNHVIPVPESLSIVAGVAGKEGSPEQIELEQAEERNLAQHGYRNWYDFCATQWGTKWDTDPYNEVKLPADSNEVIFGFDTAWGPATGVYNALMDQGFAVRSYYYEPAMAFCGVWEDGGDDYYEIGGYTSKTITEAIPEELDEMFGISKSMAEWDEEEEEEEPVLVTKKVAAIATGTAED